MSDQWFWWPRRRVREENMIMFEKPKSGLADVTNSWILNLHVMNFNLGLSVSRSCVGVRSLASLVSRPFVQRTCPNCEVCPADQVVPFGTSLTVIGSWLSPPIGLHEFEFSIESSMIEPHSASDWNFQAVKGEHASSFVQLTEPH